MEILQKKNLIFLFFLFFFNVTNVSAETSNIQEILRVIQKDLKTLEKAVYSENFSNETENSITNNVPENYSEDALTRHLLKLSDIEKQFRELTNKFEEINFKLDKLSSRLSKVQADNQLRFQNLENNTITSNVPDSNVLSLSESADGDKILPGSSEPQDLGAISYKDMDNETNEQQTQSIETTQTIITEEFRNEEKLLPDENPEKQYQFATSFLKVGDYNTAERAFREFVLTNPEHLLAGNAQYWYAETFRI